MMAVLSSVAHESDVIRTVISVGSRHADSARSTAPRTTTDATHFMQSAVYQDGANDVTSRAMALTLFADRLWESPYVYSCFVALEEKGIPYEVKEVALDKGEQKSKEFIDRTIWGRVPAIEHDGFGLAESQAILDYFEDAFPETPRILPR